MATEAVWLKGRKHSPNREKQKTDLTLTGLLMEGIWSVQKLEPSWDLAYNNHVSLQFELTWSI
jgi:hypothetical protein